MSVEVSSIFIEQSCFTALCPRTLSDLLLKFHKMPWFGQYILWSPYSKDPWKGFYREGKNRNMGEEKNICLFNV
jgi:hypothetical protein